MHHGGNGDGNDRQITKVEFRYPLLAVAVLAAIFAFASFALGYDQGQLLSIVSGEQAYEENFLHELFHDTRHALGFPCH
ncbi:MAG: CbtB domain-containing protein [Candidatus Nitrosocaldus sp.]|nr:CbtB-domain containing protein [Candidatus Nitrosocaldus sp.]MCS7140682.1 CbtB-domain containing protein [Candidatus Nitrosocaldus sp.]MDW7999503.1 CbtB domain-containing protein [Candidatus Nitrosocaldus sp.]MDW8275091.1 CbtB domain-containing protein [Candidatus Nitrosocaldus sp.]